MTDHDKLCELQEKLEEYCDHENDEHGEFVRGLCHVSNYSYCMEKDFIEALTKAMETELQVYEEYCTIVKMSEMQPHTWTELEWDN